MADVVNDSYDNRFWLGEKKLAAKAFCSVRTVERAVARMIEDGYLEIVNDRHAPGRPNEYRFLMPITPDKMSGVLPIPEVATPDKLSGEHPTSTTSLYLINSKKPRITQERRSSEDQASPQNELGDALAGSPSTPMVETLEESNTNSKTSTAKGRTIKARERDPLFDAMAEACGHNLAELTKSGATAIGSASSEVRQKGATPDQVWEKAGIYKELHPTWMLTPRALAKHWSGLQQGMERRSTYSMKLEELEQNVEEMLRDAKSNTSVATSETPETDAIGTQTASGVPKSVATPLGGESLHKTHNLVSNRSTEAHTAKADESDGASAPTNTVDPHWGLEAPTSLAASETAGIVPLSDHVASARPTAPLTESSHVSDSGFVNIGSQVQKWKDVPNDADYLAWEENRF